MYKCWERYGKRFLKPKSVESHLNLFMKTETPNERPDIEEIIWVLIPLTTMSKQQGLPTLLEGSHSSADSANNKPYEPTLQPGSALMFDARLKARVPNAGGGVVFARACHVPIVWGTRPSVVG